MMMKLGFSPESGVESILLGAAKEQSKRLEALEAPVEQLGYFDQLPEALQIRFLEATVEEDSQAAPLVQELMAAWAKGDENALERVAFWGPRGQIPGAG
jgi:uncharacterized protein